MRQLYNGRGYEEINRKTVKPLKNLSPIFGYFIFFIILFLFQSQVVNETVEEK